MQVFRDLESNAEKGKGEWIKIRNLEMGRFVRLGH